MRTSEKQWNAHQYKEVFGVNLHQFLELVEAEANHMEMAEQLGISLREVNILKKKINRA
ncbi:hypothetical protein KM914_04145 [Virgibacillus pantothenticus]|uniref:hypothetical protein n=1 Tax=Virgibacillus pantothenticus TaxID=1473 RepID=UPI001C2239BA|nr:hypothetical protein [Virgibacillus pantothenticus]MBU8565635.1 hypothetical protein [Virgibacillus pantothenticus]MBU8601283.1 hypothetical protein [Virgibacillus pantothenticus]MBU8635633.1 hypothetical protein [Virgibacillus pantothenticus]MBU8643326.1 hypothetical protein [Virgibacillus pantothenticus]MBU8647427.1 hypothetical protein [Virgibacillus pantothenticus]